VAAAVLLAACSSTATTEQTGAAPAAPGSSAPAQVDTSASTGLPLATGASMLTAPQQPGVQHLTYKFGPLRIAPGQNNISFSDTQVDKPKVDGYIVGIYPNLVRKDGTVPPVDVVHLHHGVWLNLNAKDPTSPRLPERFFASGEEKTITYLPAGYGYPYKASDPWLINYMLHNLLSSPDEVSIVYDLDFIPASDPAAKDMKTARPIWMDVQNGSTYPVFDVLKGSGHDGVYTYPDDATDPYPRQPLNEWTVDRDTTLIGTGGHLHPGGLHTDLSVRRAGAAAAPEAAPSVQGDTAHIFRSEAQYYEPAGAVSWDVAMTVTQPDWRVAVKAGDVIRTTATYDTERASWYESMGIMVMWGTDGLSGTDPFVKTVDTKGGLTHGHLAENDNHGGGPGKFTDMTKVPNGPTANVVNIADFTYGPGDMSGIYTDVPTVKPGGSLQFVNKDAPLENGIWHTITACKAPCTGDTGVAYPLADADIQFDSGQLGKAGVPTAGRLDWSVPATLPTGTYTYFCRVHPSMRGAFRVSDDAAAPATSAPTP
jgi:plastocyanin